MLQLKNIVKEYVTGDSRVLVLNGISLEFRQNEFVSILGPSGCGKTTLLNIIGGLDRYTSGDLIIGNKSTHNFKDKDWDTYRNHSVGFVFQSYNLIPHQTVLSNVELALTLTGVSKRERRQRAKAVLEKVGLGDQLRKKPNQLSGGQMQRVAIARALINNPAILLADEPTGALDSETSVQVMDLLKEVAKDRLVIMVTHNPELATTYSTRIIRLLDGKIISDSMPYTAQPDEIEPDTQKAKKPSMSFFTALSLSFQNLMTKKARTILTAFAGSIGIIGIALILSMSNGASEYIDSVERDTLSSYPVELESASVDFNSIMVSMMEQNENTGHPLDAVYSNNIMTGMIDSMVQGAANNNLEAFKKYIESGQTNLTDYTTEIRYTYSTPMNIYNADTTNGLIQVNPNMLFENMGFTTGGYTGSNGTTVTPMQNMNVWRQLSGNDETLRAQYEVVAGRFPEAYDEVVVIMDENNEVADVTLYSLGLLDQAELRQAMSDAYAGNEVVVNTEQSRFTYDEILALKFKLLVNTDYFEQQDGIWEDRSDNQAYIFSKLADAQEIRVVGILKPSEDARSSAITGTVGYRGDLMEYLIRQVNDSEIVKEQKANPDVDVLTGQKFAASEDAQATYTAEDLQAYLASLPAEQQAETSAYVQQMRASGMSEDEIANTILSSADGTTNTYEGNLTLFGVSDLGKPSGILLFPKDFEAKDQIVQIINDYNQQAEQENQLTYTDYIGLMMSSVTTIINAISYILIAFVAVSLVVSSIMIGIITYISVLERTKEIGILRSIGASKRDISRVFNAETITIGFVAGIMGILVTLALLVPINLLIDHLTDIGNLAALPTAAGIILVVISVFLTFIAGLIPSRIASKKDPVIALRTE